MSNTSTRTISADPGLLSPEELLKSHKDGRRKTLEDLIAKNNSSPANNKYPQTFFKQCRAYIKWFLDNARLKISVSSQGLSIHHTQSTIH